MPTLAVFGAGPALGLSVARRFGRAGYDVALVGRNPGTLGPLATELRAAGVGVTEVLADLAEVAQVRAAAAQLGSPDVVLYSPGDVSRLPVATLALDAEELATWLPLHLLSPVALVQAVLPGMLARGSGTLLFAQGASARTPDPALASVSAAQAGLLNYLHALATTVGHRGIDVHTMLIGSLIERSAVAALVDQGHFDEQLTVEIAQQLSVAAPPRVDPDDLADRYWSVTGRPGDVEITA
jgi:NAD(P)-dependent dehydrogenase (short-subunit alcohol dehydrogenase family)